MPDPNPNSLVKQLKQDFNYTGSEMIAEWKNLTEKDKDDLVAYYAAEGVTVTRS